MVFPEIPIADNWWIHIVQWVATKWPCQTARKFIKDAQQHEKKTKKTSSDGWPCIQTWSGMKLMMQICVLWVVNQWERIVLSWAKHYHSKISIFYWEKEAKRYLLRVLLFHVPVELSSLFKKRHAFKMSSTSLHLTDDKPNDRKPHELICCYEKTKALSFPLISQ
jgi:hypothetical protein